MLAYQGAQYDATPLNEAEKLADSTVRLFGNQLPEERARLIETPPESFPYNWGEGAVSRAAGAGRPIRSRPASRRIHCRTRSRSRPRPIR